MKTLISVTLAELEQDFSGIMDVCASACVEVEQEVDIVIPTGKGPNTHVEVVRAIPVDNGKSIRYEYDREVMDKYNISFPSFKASRIRSAIADIFEKEGIYESMDLETECRFNRAIDDAIKKFIEA